MASVNSYTRCVPTPDRTSLDAIVLAARDLLEEGGPGGLTMNAVADRVGVRAPSLYKRVRSREQVIQLVAEATLTELADRVASASTAAEVLNAFRDFGRDRPAAFRLVMMPGEGVPTARAEFGATASEVMLRICRDLAGPDRALEAARTLTSWAVGFIGMELNGNFRLGGDVDAAWEYGIAHVVAAISR